MKINLLFPILLALVLVSACSTKNPEFVLIHTSEGDIKVRLYAETPLHKQNFLTLVEDNFYDDILFHRIIKGFMVQTGDPESKDAPMSKMLGQGGPGYTIAAEIRPEFYHKKGALAAARLPDASNPKKESSGSQFYIVTGEVFSHEKLNQIEAIMNMQLRNQLIMEYFSRPENKGVRDELNRLSGSDTVAFNKLSLEVEQKMEQEYLNTQKFKFTETQREIYTTVGGAPTLDGEYTIFGEVVEGLEVVEKLNAAETDRSTDRPLNPIKILGMETVNK